MRKIQYAIIFKMEIIQTIIYLAFISGIVAQLPEEAPLKFGILTVTHARNNNYSVFLNYLRHYTEQECYSSLVSEINIIWNNEEYPGDIGAFDRQLYWRVAVNFFITKNNSLNHRFRLPQDAQAAVLYSLDDDILVDCDTLNLTYLKYLQTNTYEPGAIISNEVRSYGYLDTQIVYQGQTFAQYFAVCETGASFYPKHYLNLYYLDLPELQELRSFVESVTSCEDIYFIAIAQHFYPEMVPQYHPTQKGYRNTDPSIGLSKKKGVYRLRDQCFAKLTEALGYNPLRQFSKNYSKYENNWKFENLQLIMQSNIHGLERLTIKTSVERTVTQQFTKKQVEKQNKQISAISINNYTQKQKQTKIMPIAQNSTASNQTMDNKAKPTYNQDKPIKIEDLFIYVGIALLVAITLLLICICKLYKEYSDLKKMNRVGVPPNEIDMHEEGPISFSQPQQ